MQTIDFKGISIHKMKKFEKRYFKKCHRPDNHYCYHRHNGMCLADKIEHCERTKNAI